VGVLAVVLIVGAVIITAIARVRARAKSVATALFGGGHRPQSPEERQAEELAAYNRVMAHPEAKASDRDNELATPEAARRRREGR